jgi:AcrR family transcriptional regulator
MPAASPPRFSEAARELQRERVLGAIGELLGERVWSELTMADIAARAGVSRQTLYNSFGTRDELARLYVVREAEDFLAGADSAIRAHADDPLKALISAVQGFLAAAETHPLVRAITSSEASGELLPLVTTRGAPVVQMASERLSASILEMWPTVARAEAMALSDVLVRLAISYAALPPAPPAETAARLACVLDPAIERLLAQVPAS